MVAWDVVGDVGEDEVEVDDDRRERNALKDKNTHTKWGHLMRKKEMIHDRIPIPVWIIIVGGLR